MSAGPMREYPLLCTALLLVPTSTTKSDIKFPLVQRLTQAFCLHYLRMKRRTRCERGNTAFKAIFIDMHQKIHSNSYGRFISERNHLTKFPGRIYVQQRKWRFSRGERFLCDVQHRT